MTRLAAALANWLAARTAEFLCCAALVAGLAYGVVAYEVACSDCHAAVQSDFPWSADLPIPQLRG